MSPGGHPSSERSRSLLLSRRYERSLSGFFRCLRNAAHCSSVTPSGAANFARGEEALASELLTYPDVLGDTVSGVSASFVTGATLSGVTLCRG